MLSIINNIQFHNKPKFMLDPLEQFSFFETFVHNSDEVTNLKVMIDSCPFNIIKVTHNLVFTLDYF
jgi:hypothetical protein